MKKLVGSLLATGWLVMMPVSAQSSSELNRVLSRLQAMSHGVYSQREWQDAMRELDDVAAQALRAGQPDLVVQARAIKAMVLADMRRDIPAALQVLSNAKNEYGQQRLPSVRRLFIQEADYYGRLGDAAAVRRVIEEFRSNPNYDPASFPVQLHEGRNTPMTIARPFARGSDSVTVTAMETALERSRFAPGNLFPDFAWVDDAGRSGSINALRGKVVLVDFWHPRWTPWARDLPQLKRTYDAWNPLGFEIVGVALERVPNESRAFAASANLPWTLIYGEQDLQRQLGLFGQVSNFLIDRNGVILARDLRGSDLVDAIRRALGR